uniref:G_PROTEIN_RECEP_F1_2 domain-containing protein n=1 Tax=Haemonchus contortus TaxID=6289 RepID=A0A7I4YR02_HAECO
MSQSLQGEENLLRVWMMVSQVQFWLILVIIFISVVVISWALVRLLHLKKSHHFLFLIWIVFADLTTLFIILIDIMSQSLFISMKGPFLCKILLFFSNSSACFVNWVWLVMFVQRCAVILFPLKRDRQGLLGFLRSTKRLIIGTAIVALVTQSWPLVLVTERHVSTNDGLVAVTCERDTRIMSDQGFKWVAVFEALVSYVCPFVFTILADLLVVCCHNNSNKFTVLSSDSVSKHHTQGIYHEPVEGLKIQSRESIRLTHLRRQRAIRRCLFMATVQMILNTPYYTLQLIDEVYSLQSTPTGLLTYLYMDAVLYLLYLCQFPLVSLYISALHSDMKSCDRVRHSPVSTSVSMRHSVRSERRPLAATRSRESH